MIASFVRIVALSAAITAASLVTGSPSAAEPLQFYRSSTADLRHHPGGDMTVSTLVVQLADNGDMVIRCGRVHLTLAYNAPNDLLRPPDQPRNIQAEGPPAINGISIVASLSF